MDRRVARTIRHIKEAFVELLEQRDFCEITVKMICDRADIERKTFYLHFKDKYNLLDEIIEERLIGFRKQMKEQPDLQLTDFYRNALDAIDRHVEILKRLYNGRGSSLVRKKVQSYIFHRFEVKYGEEMDPAIKHFIAAGLSGVLEAYIKGEITGSKDQIAHDMSWMVEEAKKALGSGKAE